MILTCLSLSACSSTSTDNGGDNNNNNQQNNGGQGEGTEGDPNNQNQNGEGEGKGEGNEGGEGEEIVTNARMQDTPILHCWNWSMTNISNNLQSIKDAGFKAVQLSPMQVQKDYYRDDFNHGWWKLYQPLSFTVANDSGQNILGTKDELTSMCSKAKSLGIDVIVDVVSNHLAGGSKSSLHGSIGDYESEIASKNLIHTLGKDADDNNVQSIVQGNIGDFPDLQTESTIVQNRVISLLKEYIDCGVNGFRFDAAKHIETPDDGIYKSDYWPTVLEGATNYAKSKSLDEPFYYGEILNTCGVGRSFSSYTKYMSVVASNQGHDVFESVSNQNTSALKESYGIDVDASKLILWGESHDTYGNTWGETRNASQSVIDKAYAIQVSRKDASTLYLARPTSMASMLGDVGSRSFESSLIKSANKFHNQFLGKSENVSVDSGCFVNVRGSQGAMIVDVNKTSSTIKASGLANGTYTDILTSKKYTVSNSQISNITFTDGACILISDSKEDVSTPTLTLSTTNEIYSGTTTVNVDAQNATSVTYTINNGEATTLSGNSITLPSSLSNGFVHVKVTASNKYGETKKEISLYKTDALLNKSMIVYNIDTNYSYYCWAWGGDNANQFYSPTIEGNAMGFDIGNNNMFIIVKFDKGTTNPNWDNKINQTVDISLNQKLYNYEEMTIK